MLFDEATQSYLSAEWAWESVEGGVIKNQGGKFNSP